MSNVYAVVPFLGLTDLHALLIALALCCLPIAGYLLYWLERASGFRKPLLAALYVGVVMVALSLLAVDLYVGMRRDAGRPLGASYQVEKAWREQQWREQHVQP